MHRGRVAGVIVAGGRSRRMGRDKLLLLLDGVPVAQRVASALAQVVDEIIVALRPGQQPLPLEAHLPAHEVHDPATDMGPLGGLAAALATGIAEFYLVVAADLPLVRPALLRLLLERASAVDAQAIVPLVADRPEPLCAVYRPDCLPLVEEQARGEDRSLQGLLQRLRVEYVAEADLRAADPDLLSFLNVNRAQDLERAESLLAGEKDAG